MVKVLRITISILIASIISLASLGLCVSIKCKYDMNSLKMTGNAYRCDVEDNLNITSQNVSIESVTGDHEIGKSNSDVLDFWVQEKNVKHLPTGVEKFFANLQSIIYFKCHVKEIHQADLKPFPKLVRSDFTTNDIMVLEEGLFDYNPKLALISFRNNAIVHIHADIFNHLTKLSYLYLDRILCMDMVIENDKSVVQKMIKKLKEYCTDSDYEKIKNRLNGLEKAVKNPVLEDILSIEKVKAELKSSKFSKYSKFNNQIQSILGARNVIIHDVNQKLSLLIDSKSAEIQAQVRNEMKEMKKELMEIRASWKDGSASMEKELVDEMKEMKEQTSQSLFNLKVMCYMIVAFCGPLMTVFILAIYEYGGDFFTRLRSNRRQNEEEEVAVEESSGVE